MMSTLCGPLGSLRRFDSSNAVSCIGRYWKCSGQEGIVAIQSLIMKKCLWD